MPFKSVNDIHDFPDTKFEKSVYHPRRFSLHDAYLDPSYKPKRLRSTGPQQDVLDEYDYEQNVCRLLVLYTGGTIGMQTCDGVYSPVPNYLVTQLKRMSLFHDVEYAAEHFSEDIHSQPLVMPLFGDGKRVVYTVWEYEPLVDSCNLTMTDYARLAIDVKNNYEHYDGFVILHGTDTMAYTASALSFMFENLGKPIILTGSQIPIFEPRSDGRDNFLGALTMAGYYNIPEVTVYFNNKLIRGNRVTKMDSGSFDAFRSPNMSPLAELEIDIHVDWSAVFKPAKLAKMMVHTKMCPNVGLLRLFPSITEATVKAFLHAPMQGVVIQSYGAGNGPNSRRDLIELFREASDRGLIIINITQCSRGSVSAAYATGKAMLDAGIVPGGDMTPEAALTKLAYVIAKDYLNPEQKRNLMRVNLRGEQTVLQQEPKIVCDLPLIRRLKDVLRVSSSEEMESLKDALYPSLMCAAAVDSDVEGLKRLRDVGAIFSLSNTDYDLRTPLHIAACEGNLECVRYLLTNGASVFARDRYGNTPLDDAVTFSHHPVIKILVQTGAHLLIPTHKLGIELCLTAAQNDVKKMEAWYLAGADLNQGDYDARTAMHVGACHDSYDIVAFLLEKGLSPNIKDDFGFTAIDDARRRNRDKILTLFETWSTTQKED